MTDCNNGDWLLLKTTKDGLVHLVGVLPALPDQLVRSTFPVKVSVAVAYDANETGFPTYEDDLQTLNDLEADLRSWDPNSQVFLNAMRETGGGTRLWTLYATTADAFQSLVPPNELFAISAEPDPEWSAVAMVLASVRG